MNYRQFKSKEELVDFLYTQKADILPPYSERTNAVWLRNNIIPLVWVKNKQSGEVFLITGFCKYGVMLYSFVTFEELLNEYVFSDNSPCGVEIC